MSDYDFVHLLYEVVCVVTTLSLVLYSYIVFCDGRCKLKVWFFACLFRAACLIEKNPEFVGMKRHRASPLELTCDGSPSRSKSVV
jgi:hypothetical protein